MAKSKNNVVTHGLSGKVGDLLVFRRHGNQTVVAKIPQSKNKATESQLENRRRFQQAVLYATSKLADPATKDSYQAAAKGTQTAYNVAIADFFNAPDIHEIDLSGYNGQPGDTIRVFVSDDFMVKEVRVTINNQDGSEVENGLATPDTKGRLWTYTVTQTNETVVGDRIVVTASDMPGNVALDEVNL